MKHRYSVSLILLASCLLAFAVPASANRTMGRTAIPAQGLTLTTVRINRPASTHVTCQLGETRPPAWINSGYLFPPDDRYYTYLKVSDCAACGPGGLLITTAHMILYYSQACSIPVEVSIVPAIINSAGCAIPDVNNTICGPVPFQLTVSNPGGYDFIMALAQPCCITQDAFLLIRFVDFGTCTTLPDLVAADVPCNPCFSYNLNPSFGFIDMCADPFWAQYNTGNPNMYVDADCCDVTPTHPGSWGRVKQLYR